MSIFPFIHNTEITEQKDDLPLFQEYAYDYENNKLLMKNGKSYLISGNEALRVWIYKALSTDRFHYVAYTTDFGNEVDMLIGKTIDIDVAKSELRRFIVEALMVNPYIKELNNFILEPIQAGMRIMFDVTTIYGRQEIIKDVKGVV